MTYLQKNEIEDHEAGEYATEKDFCRVFSRDLNSLYQLSLLMTGDHVRAEQCFVAALDDCVEASPVFRGSARLVKHVIVRNAIRALAPRAGNGKSSWPVTDSSEEGNVSNGRHRRCEIDTLLALGDFERCVFVMSVLERFSERDCALLLDCAVDEIRDARIQALEQIGDSASPQEVSMAGVDFAEASY